ncbi:hypothetical protein M433DRAFT_131476 [Acidomyces richmondensis BFW]|nr:hypothetical protein M433DRAFT_131476 [Acidomyces richmondensis BFW]
MSTRNSHRDFSLFSLFTAGLACLVPFAQAYTKPVGSEPKGNPIYQPGLNSVVPAGENFTITWGPTTSGTVTLVLLKGPSSNAVPQYAIVEKIPNSGSYVWCPKTNLEPSNGAEGYGIQLIDDENGQYQYSTQFGISNPDYHASSSSSSSSLSSSSSSWGSHGSWGSSTTASRTLTTTANATSTAEASWTTEVVSRFTTYCSHATSFSMGNHTYTASSATTMTITNCPCTITKPVSNSMIVSAASTGSMPRNSSVVAPTGTMTVPSSLMTSVSATLLSSSAASGASATAASSAPSATNAANGLAAGFAGLVVAAGVAVLAV